MTIQPPEIFISAWFVSLAFTAGFIGILYKFVHFLHKVPDLIHTKA
jgi:hypothetical protein